MQYPAYWKLVEHGDNHYHKLNIIAEFLQPNQSNYYDPSISVFGLTCTIAFKPPSVIQGAPSGPRITPCGADP